MIYSFDNLKVRSKTPVFGRIEKVNWDWERALKFLDSHPEDQIDHHKEKMRFFLKRTHARGTQPKFAHEICKVMQRNFWKNEITNIAFFGFGKDCESYPWHKDRMDVFLVQVLGDIEIRVENTEYSEIPYKFKTGDCVYIPRGTHHQIITGKSRVTFSFGVEGQPDPSTYI